MDLIAESLHGQYEGLLRLLPLIAQAILVFAVFLLFGLWTARIAARIAASAGVANRGIDFFRPFIVWIFASLGVLSALLVLNLQTLLAGMLASGGILAAVIAFMFKEIGENILAGLFLTFNRPFEVGDYISSGDLEGKVMAIELRYTHVRTADARDIYIPNSQIFNRPLVNYTRDGLRRPSFTIGIDYREDPGRICGLLQAATVRAPGVLSAPAPLVTISRFDAQYIEIETSFWIQTSGRDASANETEMEQEGLPRVVRTRVMEACRAALIADGVALSADVSANLSLAVVNPVRLESGSDGARDG